MEIITYTIWDVATREIVQSGTTANADNLAVPGGCNLWRGAALSSETHVFDETGAPAERTSPRLKSQEELHVDTNRERQRRIEIGKDFDGIWLTGSATDSFNLTNLALGAQLRIGMGDTTTITVFRDGNNVDHDLVPQQLLELWVAASTYISAIYQASWALKAMDPIPQDVANDEYWP